MNNFPSLINPQFNTSSYYKVDKHVVQHKFLKTCWKKCFALFFPHGTIISAACKTKAFKLSYLIVHFDNYCDNKHSPDTSRAGNPPRNRLVLQINLLYYWLHFGLKKMFTSLLFTSTAVRTFWLQVDTKQNELIKTNTN